MQIILLVAAIGSVELLKSSLAGRRIERPDRPAATILLICLWAAASLALAATPRYRFQWRKDGAPSRLAAYALQDQRTCGLAVPRRQYFRFGYALLHSPKPVFLLGTEPERSLTVPGDAASGFNELLSWSSLPPPAGFPATLGCAGVGSDRLCLYRRPGGCRIDPGNRPYLYQETLLRLDM